MQASIPAVVGCFLAPLLILVTHSTVVGHASTLLPKLPLLDHYEQVDYHPSLPADQEAVSFQFRALNR